MEKKTVMIIMGLTLLWGGVALADSGLLFKSQRDALAAKGFTFDAHVIEDYVSVFNGGLIHKDTWLGRFDLSAELDLEKAGILKGGTVHIGMMNAHGGMKPTADGMVADLQTVSNIEAPRTTRIYEAWYNQSLLDNRLSVKFGLVDLNSEFLVSDSGNLFINSAFAIASGMFVNTDSDSIYPQPAPAVRLQYSPNDSFVFLAGLFQGNPLGPDINEHSTHFGTKEGLLSIEEGQYHYKLPLAGGLAGVLKTGFWYNSKHAENVPDADNDVDPVIHHQDYGAYVMLDQAVFRVKDAQGLNVFLLAAGAPEDRNQVQGSLGGGINYKGLIPYRENDVTGFALTSASISDKLREVSGQGHSETTYEWTYQVQINDSIHIQPDIQYVVHPNANNDTKNASVFMLRTDIHF
jgi:porin